MTAAESPAGSYGIAKGGLIASSACFYRCGSRLPREAFFE
jgi:hypothetical protein